MHFAIRFLLVFFSFLFVLGCGSKTVSFTSTCAIGAFVNGMNNITSFQTTIGKKLAVVHWYVHWQDPFPSAEADIVSANESTPMITWEPWITHEAGTLEAIASGSYESYVKEFLQAAKDWKKPLFLRFAHEMNGNWYPWDGFHNGMEEGARKYTKAWRYLANIKNELKADNIYLVWCVNNSNLPDEPWNTPEAYYPGDEYVDWIGIDGYNWGYDNWQSFDQVFGEVYNKLISLSQKPLMIAEFASAEQGGNKAAWIKDAFEKIKLSYPRLKLVCWFNINKERDWRVDSSVESADAFKSGLQDNYFSSKITQ